MDTILIPYIQSIHGQIQNNTDITDNIFNFIECNQQWLNRYQTMCDTYGKRTVNQRMGRLIKVIFNLPNTGRAKATSSLIKSYTKH
jgi:hypothetical protein